MAAGLQREHQRAPSPALPQGQEPEGTSQERLDLVALKLNARPSKTLGFRTPAEKLTELIDGLVLDVAEC